MGGGGGSYWLTCEFHASSMPLTNLFFRKGARVQDGFHHQHPAVLPHHLEEVLEDERGVFVRPVLENVLQNETVTTTTMTIIAAIKCRRTLTTIH